MREKVPRMDSHGLSDHPLGLYQRTWSGQRSSFRRLCGGGGKIALDFHFLHNHFIQSTSEWKCVLNGFGMHPLAAHDITIFHHHILSLDKLIIYHYDESQND